MKSRLLSAISIAVLAAACSQSDAGITTSVKSRLVADDLVRARTINVDTRDRVVTLRGEVRSGEEEARALEIARNTDGVNNVVDQIEVVPAASTTGVAGAPTENGPLATPTSDPDITAQVKGKLMGDPDVRGLQIDVDTENHVVTLTGSVRTDAEKRRALQLARDVAGVERVDDKLTIETRR